MAEDLKISVSVEAQLRQLDAGLRVAETKVKETTAKLDTITAKQGPFGEAFVRTAGKAFVGIKAVQGGLSLVTAASEAFQGNMEGAADAARNFPILGAVAQSLADAYASLTGITAELKKQEKINENFRKIEEGRRKEIDTRIVAGDAQADRVKALGRSKILEGQDAGGKLLFEEAFAIIDAAESAKASGIDPSSEIKAIKESFFEKFKELNEKEAETAKKGQQELARIESESRALQLEAEGRSIDARLERMEQGYRDRIQAAKDAGQEEVAVALETQARLAAIEIERDGEADRQRKENEKRLNGLREGREARDAADESANNAARFKEFEQQEKLSLLKDFVSRNETKAPQQAMEATASNIAFGLTGSKSSTDPLVQSAQREIALLERIAMNTQRTEVQAALGADR